MRQCGGFGATGADAFTVFVASRPGAGATRRRRADWVRLFASLGRDALRHLRRHDRAPSGACGLSDMVYAPSCAVAETNRDVAPNVPPRWWLLLLHSLGRSVG